MSKLENKKFIIPPAPTVFSKDDILLGTKLSKKTLFNAAELSQKITAESAKIIVEEKSNKKSRYFNAE